MGQKFLPPWTYKGSEVKSVPKGVFGFVYLITDKTNGKAYIGKKQVNSVRRLKVAKSTYDRLKSEGFPVTKTKDKKRSKKGSVVWHYKKIVEKDNGWQSYTGSSDLLNSAIKSGAKIEREILRYCKTKKELNYHETKLQFCNEVIEQNNDYYYNGNINGKYFNKDLK